MPSPVVPHHPLSLVFTGHMIDAPGRPTPRFPSRLETKAAEAIRACVLNARLRTNGAIEGIASGARGGDILFHEICRAEGIPTRIVLPFAPEAFVERSVRGVQRGGWIKRFWRVWNATADEQRVALNLGEGTDPFGECNSVMLEMAHAHGSEVELLALWDGMGAEKPGGTGAFVAATKALGGRVTQIDIRTLKTV